MEVSLREPGWGSTGRRKREGGDNVIIITHLRNGEKLRTLGSESFSSGIIWGVYLLNSHFVGYGCRLVRIDYRKLMNVQLDDRVTALVD